jgi:hypothetical protein
LAKLAAKELLHLLEFNESTQLAYLKHEHLFKPGGDCLLIGRELLLKLGQFLLLLGRQFAQERIANVDASPLDGASVKDELGCGLFRTETWLKIGEILQMNLNPF